MHISSFLLVGFKVVVDCIWSYGTNLDKAIMLDENGVTGQVSMDDRRLAGM